MTKSLAQERLDRLVVLLNHPAFLACEHVAGGAQVAFCAVHGGELVCTSCLADHLSLRHHALECDHCGARSVVAHWRSYAADLVRIRPPADDVALIMGAEIEVLLSTSCAIHCDETRAHVDAVRPGDYSSGSGSE
ncbi:MAG TPA: hypothetical protein VG650_14090 [Mycobacteriales bacterium]|nr:hypothetical protein [Mycobacteriales bacterium]